MTVRPPNIVLILADNLGWGELGCYGGGVLRGAPTPRIDALAAEGLTCLNFNVESDCVPTRSALMTGRHPIRTGALQSVLDHCMQHHVDIHALWPQTRHLRPKVRYVVEELSRLAAEGVFD